MHFDEVDVCKCKSSPLQSHGRGQHGRLQQLFGRIDGRVGITAYVREWSVSQRLRPVLTHQEHGRAAIGERRRVARRDAAVAPVEDRPERRECLQRRVGPNTVVRRHRVLSGWREIHRRNFRRQATVLGAAPGVAVRRQSEFVLFASRNRVQFGHLLGGLSHRLAGRQLSDRRRDGDQVLRAQLGERL